MVRSTKSSFNGSPDAAVHNLDGGTVPEGGAACAASGSATPR
jgi:hypothetical protein